MDACLTYAVGDKGNLVQTVCQMVKYVVVPAQNAAQS